MSIHSFLQGLIWKDTAEIYFCRISKNKIVFCTNGGAEQNTNTILSKSIDNQTTKSPFQSLQDKKEQK